MGKNRLFPLKIAFGLITIRPARFSYFFCETCLAYFVPMSPLPVLTGTSNSVLRSVSLPIKKVDKNIQKLIKTMEVTVKKAKGVGLAAPQIGENIRLILVQMNGKQFLPMVNPEISEFSLDNTYDEEGCLSIPGEFGNVWRAKEVMVSFLDEVGRPKKLRLNDFSARIVQHEIDHLNGILFVDRISEIVSHTEKETNEQYY